MELNEKIIAVYPELQGQNDPLSLHPLYTLQNDSDGLGTYIKEWNYNKPQPTKAQLDAIHD